MGVPSFFRWLTKKYPSVIVHCVEDKVVEIDGVLIPVDSTAPNPNGVEFDNLYLDMNGIIHPCTHPENKPAPKNEDEMMIAIFECIDRLFRIVRPRKLLYMAIDGVAPRAKMNQQRSRRFRATKETSEKLNEIERIREDMEARGLLLPPMKERGEHFDSNCITPGTPFMDRLSKALNYYVHERLNTDPAWKNVKVILSDANAPGEGEHKVMDFIRRQRAQPGHDPNTSHCLCGADADLIMLGLATHEPNFTIIREEFRPNSARPCDICGQNGHEMKDCLGLEKECPEDGPEPPPPGSELEFIFVRLNVLREYLQKELEMPNLPFKFDLDRAVDDWVFMCFFVGNDFLPHLPSLEIREGAIDRLVRLYKKCVYKTGGWLTDSGIPNLSRVQLILSELGEMEDEIFKNRQTNELKWKARQNADKRRRLQDNANCYSKPAWTPGGSFAPSPLGKYNTPSPVRDVRNEAYNMRVQGMHTTPDGRIPRSNQDAAAALKAMITNKDSPGDMDSSFGSSTSSSPGVVSVNSSPIPYEQRAHLKRKSESRFGGPEDDEEEEEENNDEVRLWEDGFKDRYYESKFDVLPDNVKFRIEVGHQYVRGLCWVLRYYYQGCASWGWYYPYHYAPFASDFINVGDLSTEFINAKPFSPLEQLMSVFPAASRKHVPEPWGELMLDPESPIIDFYPDDFQIDLNGKKFAWQGVALLPFVDEVRLKLVLRDHYSKLTDDEVLRNTLGEDRIYVRKGHSGYDFLVGLYENAFDENARVALDASSFQGMGGDVRVSKELVPFKGILQSPIPKNLDVVDNEVVLLWFRDLQFEPGHIFPASRLEGAEDPPKVLKPGDLTPDQSRNWRPMIGMTHSNQRASLDMSGHRALNSAVGGGGGQDGRNQGRGSYGGNNMPPPNSYDDQRNNRNRNSGGHYDNSRGYNNNSGGGGYNSYTPRGGGSNYGGGGGYQGGYGGNRYDSGYGGGGNSGGRGGGYGGGYQPRGGGNYGGPGSSGQRSSFGFQDRTPPNRNNDYNNRGGGRGGRNQNPGYFTSGYNSGGGGGGGNNRY